VSERNKLDTWWAQEASRGRKWPIPRPQRVHALEGGIGGSISLDVFLADGPTSRRLVTSQFTKLPEDRLIRSTYLRLARVELRGAMVPGIVGRSRGPKSC